MDLEPPMPHYDAVLPSALPRAIPLAALTVDGFGAVAYWGPGARRLFGQRAEEVIGAPAASILPVTAVIDSVGDGELVGAAYAEFPPPVEPAHPTTGRFWGRGDGPDDVLWWGCPLTGPGLQRLLLLATDGGALHRDPGSPQLTAAFASHGELPDRENRLALLHVMLPGLETPERADLIDQLLTCGYPVLENEAGQYAPVVPRLPDHSLP